MLSSLASLAPSVFLAKRYSYVLLFYFVLTLLEMRDAYFVRITLSLCFPYIFEIIECRVLNRSTCMC